MSPEKALNQRPIPSAALADPNAVEMLRVWIAQRQLHCSLKVGMFSDATGVKEEVAWGTVLADAARHISNAIEQGFGGSAFEALAEIRAAFLRELDKPSSETKGSFADRH